MRANTWIVMLATLLTFVAGGADAVPATDARVSITDFKFQPARVQVAPGGTVTWVNDDDEEHTVTATDRTYTSAGLDGADTYSHRFTVPGTYQYYCALHPHMTATVVVK